MKPYLVYQYLLKNTDENHYVSAEEIVEYLKTSCGIYAERRSIYTDIDAINRALWLLENDESIDAIDEEYFEDEKAIIYDKHFKGFYVRERHFDSTDIRLIAECIYSSNYITQENAKRLIKIMKEFLSDYQAESIHTDALITNRVRTLNKTALSNINVIYDAMSNKLDGENHVPEKVSFHYLKYSISDINNQIERRQGAVYTVSPFKLIINDSNYYLLAFDDASNSMRTYRVDRMKDIKRTGVAREGSEEFSKIDIKSYTQKTFAMYGGNETHVVLKFRNSLLDTVIEKLGRTNVSYTRADDNHFNVSADIEVSPQFFGWLCGLGVSVQIVAPASLRKQYKDYLLSIVEKHE